MYQKAWQERNKGRRIRKEGSPSPSIGAGQGIGSVQDGFGRNVPGLFQHHFFQRMLKAEAAAQFLGDSANRWILIHSFGSVDES